MLTIQMVFSSESITMGSETPTDWPGQGLGYYIDTVICLSEDLVVLFLRLPYHATSCIRPDHFECFCHP
jgi:hypothetical protein